MPTSIVSPEAEQDLLDIWSYIAEDSPVNTDRFLDRLERKSLKLSEFTKIGINRPELASNLKSFPVD
ncbi:MAG TPA: type II toxin-antitoxin system RelE/ParE family toxin [Gammaproteobacteria bacterium]|nr:type II toxin-antitoxin system RelE/ParE family toxin [Gammaproteobacteria bacterium]